MHYTSVPNILKVIKPLFLDSLEKGEEVKLSGFGNFSLLKKNARPGRNPKTGKEYVISARTSISFKPGRKLRDKIV